MTAAWVVKAVLLRSILSSIIVLKTIGVESRRLVAAGKGQGQQGNEDISDHCAATISTSDVELSHCGQVSEGVDGQY